MPRPLPDENQSKALRQARYRASLAARAEPEADRVDTALAAAVAALADALADKSFATAARKDVFNAIVRGSIRLLRSEGYDMDGIKKVLRRRFSSYARPDLERISDVAKVKRSG